MTSYFLVNIYNFTFHAKNKIPKFRFCLCNLFARTWRLLPRLGRFNS